MALSNKESSFIAWLERIEDETDDEGNRWIEYDENTVEANLALERVRAFVNEAITSDQLVESLIQVVHWEIGMVVEASIRSQGRSDTSVAWDKVRFVLTHVLVPLLKSSRPHWREMRHALLRSWWHSTFLLIEKFSDDKRVQHHKTDVLQTQTHFHVKSFLARVACDWMVALFQNDIKFDPDITIPVLRRLALRDVLDEEWNYYGAWQETLDTLSQLVGDIQRIPMDERLYKTTFQLKMARNSSRCQRLPTFCGMPTPPQSFLYFPKCSSNHCNNIETKEKPHSLRCTRCYYYHYCSESCKALTDSAFHLRYCQSVPSDKVEACKQATEAYLGGTENDKAKTAKQCSVCGLLKEHTNDKALKLCSHCRRVYYCGVGCQRWHWKHGGHKEECKDEVSTSAR